MEKSREKPKWEPGWDGCETPFDYGWMRGTLDLPLTPDVYFPARDDYEEYREGYREAKRNW